MNPRMTDFERDSLLAVLHSKGVWLIHVIVNALLILSFFYWTRIPDERGWQFTMSVISGLSIVFITLWLHSATFDYFRLAPRSFKVSLRRAVTRIPAFLVWTLIFGFVLWAISLLWNYDEQIGAWARHTFPEFLRRQISPRSVISAANGAVFFLCFFLWPIFFVPVGAQVATRGLRGFFTAAAFRPVRELRFWIAYAVCFVIGAYLPYRLAWMTPDKPSSLNAQTWSMVMRLGLGYLLLVTAWLVLCAAIMRASEGETETSVEPETEPVTASPTK
ncbi:MAG TPA: hypothetical protein VN577_05515 [Terriglobales bacterium]|nr:hypothetical protein [Terriglobales bacterium]